MKKLFILLFLLLPSFLFAEETLKEGTWQRIDYRVSGTWQIIQKADGLYVVLSEKFKTRSGPDLHILFSKKKVTDLTDSNTSPSSRIIGELKSSRGFQEFKIPDDINWQEFNSIVIHCVAFSHVWAGANF